MYIYVKPINGLSWRLKQQTFRSGRLFSRIWYNTTIPPASRMTFSFFVSFSFNEIGSACSLRAHSASECDIFVCQGECIRGHHMTHYVDWIIFNVFIRFEHLHQPRELFIIFIYSGIAVAVTSNQNVIYCTELCRNAGYIAHVWHTTCVAIQVTVFMDYEHIEQQIGHEHNTS